MINRRTFLQTTAIAATAAAVSSAAEDAKSIPIIDCHQHLWDLDKQDIPWLENGNSPQRRNYVMSDYREAIAGTGIKHAVYMEVDVARGDKINEGEMLTAICKAGDSPTVAAVIGGIPDDPDFAAYVKRWKDNSYIKGMRIVLGNTPANSPPRLLTKEFLRGINALGEAGLSFDLCLPPSELGHAVKLVAACPKTRFIVDHCGNADPKWWGKDGNPPAIEEWKKNMSALAAEKRTICKISGIIASVPKDWSAETLAPAINFCLDTWEADRVIFGSDWPVCLKGAPLAAWVKTLREIMAERPAAEQKKLLFDNAAREYALKL